MIERVLYVNQAVSMSGAERSLIELIHGLPESITPLVACPPGEFSAAVEAAGIPLAKLQPVDLSFRLHPVRTPVGLAWIPRAAIRIRTLARSHRAQLVHANSTRAGFPAVLARRLGGPPVLVHARDPVPENAAGRATIRVIERGAEVMVANSRFVASQYSDGGARVRVIHNSVDPTRFDPGRADREAVRRELGLGQGPVLALVAHFTPWKAQDDAVRILAELKARHPDARLLLIGSVKFADRGGRFDTAAFRNDVERLAASLGVGNDVIFTGERNDIPALLSAVDVLLVPSWWEPFGRVVVEGMAMGLAVVATSEGGPAEIIRSGVDGITLPPRDPNGWAAEVGRIVDSEAELEALGAAARERVIAEFGPDRVTEAILEAYEAAVG